MFLSGSAVGLMLPEDADESVFELLEIILDGITLQLEPEERGMSRTRLRREVGLAHSVVRGKYQNTLLDHSKNVNEHL